MNALWADQVTRKPSLNTFPYFLVYGKEYIVSLNIYLTSLKNSQESQGKPYLLVQHRMGTLHKLQEERMKAKEKITLHQNHIKRWFDRNSIGITSFSVGDLVLRWDKPYEDKGKHTKFQSLWIIPFIVRENLGQHTYHLQSLDRKIHTLHVNGQDLKYYFQ